MMIKLYQLICKLKYGSFKEWYGSAIQSSNMYDNMRFNMPILAMPPLANDGRFFEPNSYFNRQAWWLNQPTSKKLILKLDHETPFGENGHKMFELPPAKSYGETQEIKSWILINGWCFSATFFC